MELKQKQSRNGSLLKQVYTRYYMVLLLGMMAMFASVAVDSVITGQYLGKDAVAAMGVLSPSINMLMVITALFGIAGGQLCTRCMGRADIKKMNSVFSTIISCSVFICLVTGVILYCFASEIATMLAPTVEAKIHDLAADYLRGYAFNIVPTGIAMSLNPIMTLDNDQTRSLKFTSTAFVSDIILDLLNVLVFHVGLFGMAIATTLSTVIGLTALLRHFWMKGHLINYSIHSIDFSCLKEAVFIGFGQNLGILVSSIYFYFINNLLLEIGGSGEVASLAVCNSVFNLMTPVFNGLMISTSAVMNLSFGEEDKHSLVEILGISFRIGHTIVYSVVTLIFIFAGPIAGVFIRTSDPEILQQASRFIRVYALMNLFTPIYYSMCGSFMGTRNVKFNYFLSTFKEGVYPVSCAMLLGRMFGIRGVEAGLVIAGALTALTCFLIPWIRNRKMPTSAGGFLMLPEDFDAKASELFEASLYSFEDVPAVAEKAFQFCLERQEEKKTSMLVSLFIEEIAGNTFHHGFENKKNGMIELRLVLKENKRVVRLRDNGGRFDPVKWLNVNHPKSPEEGIGIRMIVGMAKEVLYVPAMGLNSIMINL